MLRSGPRCIGASSTTTPDFRAHPLKSSILFQESSRCRFSKTGVSPHSRRLWYRLRQSL